MLVEFPDGSLSESCEIGIGIHDEVITAGGFCETSQGFGIKLADDMLAVGILPQPVVATGIRYGTTCGCANADCDNQQLALFGFFCHL